MSCSLSIVLKVSGAVCGASSLRHKVDCGDHVSALQLHFLKSPVAFSLVYPDTSCDQSSGFMSFHELSELIHELAGFMVVVTGEGKLLYLSENVIDHLGLCMVSTLSQNADK